MTTPTIDHADKYRAQLEAQPEPTDAMWDRWAATVNALAPDLADMLLGERAGGAT